MHRLAVFVFALAILVPGASAQLTRLSNTGCTPLTSPGVSGGVALGQTLGIQHSCGSATEVPFTILGLEFPVPVPVPTGIDCTAGTCSFGCSLLVVLPVGTLSLPIPNDTSLRGQCFCFQCGCWDTSTNCMTLTVAVRACVQ